MLVILGSDHAGLELKKQLAQFLKQHGYPITDVGTQPRDSCDYFSNSSRTMESVLFFFTRIISFNEHFVLEETCNFDRESKKSVLSENKFDKKFTN